MFQLRVSFVKDVKKQEEMWEVQHELAAEKIYATCADLGGFFLKVFERFTLPQMGFWFCAIQLELWGDIGVIRMGFGRYCHLFIHFCYCCLFFNWVS